MVRSNLNYQNLVPSYLFADIAKRVAAYKAENPDRNVISLGIGDVTLPLPKPCTDAMAAAVADMTRSETFRGYGPEQGYPFFKDAVRDYYALKGVELGTNEIFCSDGAKSDLGNFLDILSRDLKVLVPDPVYPVYVDTNIMDGRQISTMSANDGNGWCPVPDENTDADVVYICSPNNPTGAVYTREALKKWVNWANARGSLILFDAAYEAFVGDPGLPRSIYQIDGARTCAVEFSSFSKTAGFTGTRCGYTVVPNDVKADGVALNPLWLRRQTTKFNGVSYITQRGAAAALTPDGIAECMKNIGYYKKNAGVITSALDALGIGYCGGKNSPYIWLRCPGNMGSWEFFDLMLTKANVVGTPGEGFGECGRGCFRLTSFGSAENTVEAMRRITTVLSE